MGFFDEIKKVLFGVKAVSKSAAGKVAEKGREAANKSGDLIDKAKDKVEDLADDIGDSAENIWEKTVDSAETISSKVKDKAEHLFDDAKDLAEDIGEKISDQTEGVLEEAKDFVEDIGEKVIGVAGMASEKVKDIGEKIAGKVEDLKKDSKSPSSEITDELFDRDRNNLSEANRESSSHDNAGDALDSAKSAAGVIGGKIEGVGSEIVDKAKDLSEKLSGQLDETLEKAKNLAEDEANTPEYKTPSEHLHKNALDDKDDFFKKAEAFADGRYDEVSDPFSDKPTIVRSGSGKINKEKSSSQVPGFEDLDGDGDELIDDALLDSDT